MVLSGTLKEFILADVFNLLTQQKITGRLDLTIGKREAGIVFKDGAIVGADDADENLSNKLFNYLVDVKRKAPERLSSLFGEHSGDLSVLASALLEHGLLTAQELKGFAEPCVEDICCSLLAWNEGTYNFNSHRNVAKFACGVVDISAENIIMEGMRRVDEWTRMREYITDEMVFAPVKGAGGASDGIDIVAAPEEYVLGLLDGVNTVKGIKASCCLCEYKVYESISVLLQSQRISVQQQKYSHSIQAALARKEAEVASAQRTTLFGSLLAAGVAAVFVAFFIFCRVFLLPGLDADANVGGIADNAAMRADAVEGASQLYRAVSGGEAGSDPKALKEALKSAGFLTDRDL
jgi:hypothetical protein